MLEEIERVAKAGVKTSGKPETRVHRIRIYRQEVALARVKLETLQTYLNLELGLLEDELCHPRLEGGASVGGEDLATEEAEMERWEIPERVKMEETKGRR